MFMENFDSETSASSHFQCDMMPGKTFFYNKQEDEFFLCYEGVHMHVQPITDKVLEMVEERNKEARIQLGNWDGESGSGLSHKSFSGVIHSQAKQSKAFTGAGTRLGGSDEGSTQELVSDPLRDPMLETILALANSSATAQMRQSQLQKDDEDPDTTVHSKYPDDMDVDSN